MRSSLPGRRALLAGSTALLALLGRIEAVNMTWDADSVTAGQQDGSGAWNLTNSKWFVPEPGVALLLVGGWLALGLRRSRAARVI
jgi:hypothetical protein